MEISPGGGGGPPSLVGLTTEEMSHKRLSDPELCLILDWLSGEVEPEEGKLFLANPAVKHYHINMRYIVAVRQRRGPTTEFKIH